MLLALLAAAGVGLLVTGIYLPRTGKDVIAERFGWMLIWGDYVLVPFFYSLPGWFLVRNEELAATMKNLESDLALEITHGYLKPIEVDQNVALLAVVGEGMRGTAGLAGRIFDAVSRQHVNIIAIAQGSSELTISMVVRRDGLERALCAVHEECR